MKKIITNLIKKTGRPAKNALFQFLMLPTRKMGGRKLFDFQELKLVHQALVSQNLFGIGGVMVPNFERQFAEEYGVPYAVASTSGTAAIHTALGALDLNAGDEVITAPITDLGTIIPILYQNTIPVFADVDATYQMDPEDVERKITPRTKAILAVHLFGNACAIDRIVEIGKRRGIPVIEDCSQAHVTEYKGKFVGTWGDIGCYSFQQSKHMTTGDGGMTITSNKGYYERMKLFVDKGYARKGWGARAYLFHAPNYRMNELTAAVGIAQLKKVKAVVKRRHAMGELMTELLKTVEGVEPVAATPGASHSYWLYAFRTLGQSAEALAKEMTRQKFYAMPGYTGKPIYLCTESLSAKKTYGDSQLPFSWNKDKQYEYKEGLCPKAEKGLDSLVCMPWDESWDDVKIRRAVEVIKQCLSASLSNTKVPAPSKAVAPQTSAGSDLQKKLKVAVIGCGQIGRWHFDAYKKNSEAAIVAVVDTDRERAEKFAAEVGAKAYTSHQDMLKNERLDAASLCTVPSTHHDIAIDLLDACVHVLCEKPLGLSVEQAERMLQKARDKNKHLLIAFKLRFSEEVLKAKELIDSGSLGHILHFRLLFGGYMDMADTWYAKKEISGGGVLMDNGPHAVDLIHYLFGDIKDLSASRTDLANAGVEHTAKLDVKVESGVTGSLTMSWSVFVTPQAYLEIYGDQGAALLDVKGLTYKFNTWSDWKRLPNKADVKDAFAFQINHFLAAAKGGDARVVDGAAGLKAQKVIEAAYESIKQDSRIVLSL